MSIFLVTLVLGDPVPEIQKSRGPNSSPSTHLNAVSKSNNNNGKGSDNIQIIQQTSTPDGRPNLFVPTTQSPPQQQIFVSNGQQVQQPQHQQYFLTMSPNANTMTGVSGQTPIIMQYLPQGQTGSAGGQYQYIQLVAARPLVYPQFIQPQQLSQQIPQQQYLSSVPQSPSNSLSQQTYQTPFSPIISHNGQTSPHAYPTYSPLHTSPQTIVGGYSNHQPVVSPYYNPTQRVQLVSSPPDLSLNTNEYFPKGFSDDYRLKSRV